MVNPFTKVLVGTDFSDGAQLHVVHVRALPQVATSLAIDTGLEWQTPVEHA